MKTLEDTLFGDVPAPESLSQLIEIIERKGPPRLNVYMWRGQGDIRWPIHSAAYRRLSMNPMASGAHRVTESQMRWYELELLQKARHQGYGYEEGRRLTDFEVLAKLQHHGAATRLLDFSRNMLVALWFACQSQPDETGLLFGLHTQFIFGEEGAAEERDYAQIFSGEQFDVNGGAITWQPPVVTKRIAAQSAQFVYSAVSDHAMGSLKFIQSNDAYIAIALTPHVKRNLLYLLEENFDIRALTLFPDIDGFCAANSERFYRYSNDRW